MLQAYYKSYNLTKTYTNGKSRFVPKSNQAKKQGALLEIFGWAV